MRKEQIMDLLVKLKLSPNQYVVFGGATMALRGIREADDLDLFVTPKLFEKLKKNGWKEKALAERPPYLVNRVNGFEMQAFHVWVGGKWQPQVEHYLKDPEVIEGVPCMPLKELYAWKFATKRPKDLYDLKLIKDYLSN